ncbi:MAG: PQQ-binding-like beta-propeller repeat protein [Candidatus Latescibacteria bacterium]|nr:PQQ-binding-like beta-propeller repeat protein [Candidatus Latescibacterota bacterium]
MIRGLCGVVLLLLSGIGAAQAPFPYALQWKHFTRTPATALAWGDSLVYAGEGEGLVSALRQQDGTQVWQRRGYGPLRRPLVLAGGQVLVADAWGRVEVLAASAGAPLWSAQRQGWGEAGAAVEAGRCFLGSADGWLYALSAADGVEAWRLYTGASLPSRPWASQGQLYTAARSGQLLQVDLVSGTRLGQADTQSPVVAGPVGAEDRLVVGCADGYVRAFRRQSLASIWQQRLGAPLQAEPVWVQDRLVCLAGNGWIYGLDLSRGEVKWRFALEAKGSGPLAIGPAGEVLVATDQGEILALEPRSGRLLWRQQVLARGGLYLLAAGPWLYAGAADGYLYAFRLQQPIPPNQVAAWENWQEVFARGAKTGYKYQMLRSDRFQETTGWHFLEEEVSWAGGFVRRHFELWTDLGYRPLAFVEQRREESQLLEVVGAWEGDQVRLEQHLDGRTVQRQVTTETGAVLAEVALLKLVRENRTQVGRHDSLRIFDPSSETTGTLYVDFEAGEGEAAFLARLGSEPGGGDVLCWLDAQGRQVHRQVPLVGGEEVRVSAAQACAWGMPGPDKGVWLDYPVPAPAKIERLVLELPSHLLGLLVVQDERQQVVEGMDGRLRLAVQRLEDRHRDAARLPILAPGLEPFLQPSLYVQSDDPRIRELAAELRGQERDAWQVVLRLQRWVYDRMTPTETAVRFKSTAEILAEMEGTCSEYTVLFLSLCRAAGIPARACAGLVASPSGMLIPHLWAEVYVGYWASVDPTWDEVEVDAVHIQFSAGDLAPQTVGRLNSPVGLFLAFADTLKLGEYFTGETRFLGEAEGLFVQAGAGPPGRGSPVFLPTPDAGGGAGSPGALLSGAGGRATGGRQRGRGAAEAAGGQTSRSRTGRRSPGATGRTGRTGGRLRPGPALLPAPRRGVQPFGLGPGGPLGPGALWPPGGGRSACRQVSVATHTGSHGDQERRMAH